MGFTALSAPAGGGELVFLEYLGELFLVAVGFNAEGLLEEFSGVVA